MVYLLKMVISREILKKVVPHSSASSATCLRELPLLESNSGLVNAGDPARICVV